MRFGLVIEMPFRALETFCLARLKSQVRYDPTIKLDDTCSIMKHCRGIFGDCNTAQLRVLESENAVLP